MTELGSRLEGVRKKVQKEERREKEGEERVRRRLRILWSVLGVGLVLFLILGAVRCWPGRREDEDRRNNARMIRNGSPKREDKSVKEAEKQITQSTQLESHSLFPSSPPAKEPLNHHHHQHQHILLSASSPRLIITNDHDRESFSTEAEAGAKTGEAEAEADLDLDSVLRLLDEL